MFISLLHIPDPLLTELVRGCSGRWRLQDLARQARAYGLEELADDMDLAAWETDPLDGELAFRAARVVRDKELAASCRNVARNWKPVSDPALAQAVGERNLTAASDRLDALAAADPDNLYWLHKALAHDHVQGRPERARERLERAGLRGCAGGLARAHAAFQDGDYPMATALYAGLPECLAEARARRAEGLHRMGDPAAGRVWRKALLQRSWMLHWGLRLHDVAEGRDRAEELPSGKVVVCLYSFNKARELDATLEALWASDLGDADILVLDNGSTDGGGDVLDGWERKAGPRLQTIRLPANVGAPAARNWLAQQTRGYDWLAFLDDDALAPRNWLRKLGAAVRAQPGAGVWGCRVVDATAPAVIQHADGFIRAGGETVSATDRPEHGYERRFQVLSMQNQDLDFGQFSYGRPCATVTGCCHLFRTRTLAETGGFDIGLSPTQYDDLDHDLRLLAAGKPPVYWGHLTVRHAKRSGVAGRTDHAAFGSAFANLRTLQHKYPPGQARDLCRAVDKAALADVAAKLSHIFPVK